MSWPDDASKHHERFRCDRCGKEFPAYNGQTRFCSYRCVRIWMEEGDWSVYVNVGKYHFLADNRGVRVIG